MKHLIIIALCMAAFLTADAQITAQNYRVYDVRKAKEVTLKDIAEDMAGYDVLFFGEEHNDSVTHYLEKTMLATMHEKFGEQIALSMEMFDRDVQPVMDEYLKGYIREKHLVKDARAWSNYRDYRPMVEFAKEKKLDVICANAPTRYTNLAGRKGQKALEELPDATKKYFAPLPYDTATGDYYAKLMGLPRHGAQNDTAKKPDMPAMMMPGFSLITAQSLWDATMAYSIAGYLKKNKGKKVMHVNGRFHSDEGFAVAAQLRNNYAPKAKRLIISTASDEKFPNINWDEYKTMGDYVIITDPNVPRTYKD